MSHPSDDWWFPPFPSYWAVLDCGHERRSVTEIPSENIHADRLWCDTCRWQQAVVDRGVEGTPWGQRRRRDRGGM